MAQRRGSAEIFWTKGSVENEVGWNRLCEQGVRSWELRGSCSRKAREKDANRWRGASWGIYHFSIRKMFLHWIRRIKGKKFCTKRGFRRDTVVQATRECGSYFLFFLIEFGFLWNRIMCD